MRKRHNSIAENSFRGHSECNYSKISQFQVEFLQIRIINPISGASLVNSQENDCEITIARVYLNHLMKCRA